MRRTGGSVIVCCLRTIYKRRTTESRYWVLKYQSLGTIQSTRQPGPSGYTVQPGDSIGSQWTSCTQERALPHRLFRLRLVGLLTVLLTGQISGLPVSMVQVVGVYGKADVTTLLLLSPRVRRALPGVQPGATRLGPMHLRLPAPRRHGAAPAQSRGGRPGPDGVTADYAVQGAPAMAVSLLADFTPVPPSPPPWVRALGVLI